MLYPLIEVHLMSTHKTKCFKKAKKINNTIWLDKLINQLEPKHKDLNYENI